MNNKPNLIALCSAFILAGASYANNPTTKEYVDAQIRNLQSQINATSYAVGDQAMGGIVFWVDKTGQHGLIAAKADNSTGVAWDPTNSTPSVTAASSDGVFAGKANNCQIMAIEIQNGVTDDFAAQVCANYSIQANGTTDCASPGTAGASCYADWYLPSEFELNQLYLQRTVVGGFNLVDGNYWSSTEYSQGQAWLVQFSSSGAQQHFDKSNPFLVRCIRAF